MCRPAPDTTIVVPAADSSAALARCLAGLERQSWSGQVRVLVIESGTRGGIAAVAGRFGAGVVRVGRPGPAAACNAGLAATETPYIAFLSTECHPHPGWLAGLHAALAGGAHGGVFGRTTGMSGVGRLNALFYKGLLREVGAFDPRLRYSADFELVTRIVGYGRTVGYAEHAVAEAAGRAPRGARRELERLRATGEIGRGFPADRARRWIGGRPLTIHTRLRPGVDKVCLTIDDGPSENTPRLLRVLRRHGAKASFFVIGKQARAHPAILRDILAEGHDVHGHSWTHREFDILSRDEVRDELARTGRELHTTSRPLIRLPFGAGASDPYVHAAIRRWRRDCALVQWSVDSEDWKAWWHCTSTADVEREAAAAAGRVLGAEQLPGSVVLLHDSAYGARLELIDRFAASMLDQILSGLAARGLRTTLLSEAV